MNPEEYAKELRQKGMPGMDLRINLHNDGDLEVGIYNCSMTDFTAEKYYPDGREHSIDEVAKDLMMIFRTSWSGTVSRSIE